MKKENNGRVLFAGEFMKEEYNGQKALIANIFNQAICDYKKALKLQKQNKLSAEQKILIESIIVENEIFFKSEWAEDLAEYLHISFNPEKLIEKLRSEV